MNTIYRFQAAVECPCGRANEALLPAAECGTEFVWLLRCRACGAWRWFHAKRDAAFGEAVRATAARRGEAEGLSEEGTVEAHGRFAASIPGCSCGARFAVVRRVEDEPCLSCGRPLRDGRWPAPDRKVQVEVAHGLTKVPPPSK